jgi:hypothetical protein
VSTFRIALLSMLACCVVAAPCAHAGGEMGEAKHKDEGIRFFGFVRDANGKPVPEAKVVAEIKNSTRYITHTTKNGMYSFGGFTKSVKPDDVTISCSMDNYQQAKVIRKTPTGGKVVKAVETECRMQRQ